MSLRPATIKCRNNRSWKVTCPYSRSQYENRGERESEQRELSGSLMKCHGCWYRSRSRVHSLDREGTPEQQVVNTGASLEFRMESEAANHQEKTTVDAFISSPSL